MSQPPFEEYEAEVQRPTGRYQRLPHGYASSSVTAAPNTYQAQGQIARLEAELAELRQLYADRDADLRFEYNGRMLAEDAVRELRAQLHAARAEVLTLAAENAALQAAHMRLQDAALIDYSTGSLTTYTPVGERLVLDKLTY